MGLDEIEQRLDGGTDVTNLVSERLGRQIDPFAAKAPALAVKRLVLGELVEDDGGEQVGAEKATWRCMEGRRCLTDAAAVQQVNFSRTVSTTLKRRGISSSVSVTSSPSFDRRSLPQWVQAVGAWMTTRSRTIFSGQGFRTGRLRVNARTAWVLAADACEASSSSVASATSSSSCSSIWSISR